MFNFYHVLKLIHEIISSYLFTEQIVCLFFSWNNFMNLLCFFSSPILFLTIYFFKFFHLLQNSCYLFIINIFSQTLKKEIYKNDKYFRFVNLDESLFILAGDYSRNYLNLYNNYPSIQLEEKDRYWGRNFWLR